MEKEINLITQILNNRDLRFIEKNKDQKSLAKEIQQRLSFLKLKQSLENNGYYK